MATSFSCDQIVQAAIEGHGVALGRLALMQPMLRNDRLVAQADGPMRNGDYGYWLIDADTRGLFLYNAGLQTVQLPLHPCRGRWSRFLKCTEAARQISRLIRENECIAPPGLLRRLTERTLLKRA